MVLLGDEAEMEARFGPFGDSVSVGARFAPHVPLAQKSVWTHPMVLLGDEAQVEYLILVHLDIVLDRAGVPDLSVSGG